MRWDIRAVLLLALLRSSFAADLDPIGLTQLRIVAPTLLGTGVQVAHPEAIELNGTLRWQVNPAVVGRPESLFTWISSSGVATTFPNSVGTESSHADTVGNLFYGALAGVVPGVAHVENYDAGYFYQFRVQPQTALAAKVINQSFVFGSQNAAVDSDYDNYAARYVQTVFVSGVGNAGPVNSSATAYNGIGVGAFGGSSSVGPTTDGRSKPDITAPAALTSYSTPLVAGGAALLVQAGARGDGGAGTASAAVDSRMVKALLLNGAEKPEGWTNSSTSPLDARYGAGVLQVLNSYRQLRGGKHPPTTSTTAIVGEPHLPPGNTNNIPAWRGWDFNAVTSTAQQDGINHYLFELSGESNRLVTLKATLVWQRRLNQTVINDLDLFLFDTASNTLVLSSQSLVDNVEHLFLPGLPPGRYDLQVFKHGGSAGRLTTAETYALAFDFGPPQAVRLINPAATDGQFQSRLMGEPNQSYVIEATSDFNTWVSILTRTASGEGLFDFIDPQPGGAGNRFYRARLAP